MAFVGDPQLSASATVDRAGSRCLPLVATLFVNPPTTADNGVAPVSDWTRRLREWLKCVINGGRLRGR
jgi:hypothetical protein